MRELEISTIQMDSFAVCSLHDCSKSFLQEGCGSEGNFKSGHGSHEVQERNNQCILWEEQQNTNRMIRDGGPAQLILMIHVEKGHKMIILRGYH